MILPRIHVPSIEILAEAAPSQEPEPKAKAKAKATAKAKVGDASREGRALVTPKPGLYQPLFEGLGVYMAVPLN